MYLRMWNAKAFVLRLNACEVVAGARRRRRRRAVIAGTGPGGGGADRPGPAGSIRPSPPVATRSHKLKRPRLNFSRNVISNWPSSSRPSALDWLKRALHVTDFLLRLDFYRRCQCLNRATSEYFAIYVICNFSKVTLPSAKCMHLNMYTKTKRVSVGD